MERYGQRGLAMVGVHTPEGEGEKKIESVRSKANEVGFNFPIVIDNERKNWDLWGAGVWPSVYVIDKRGYIRYWWIGELKWQGNDGEKVLSERIEQLLAET